MPAVDLVFRASRAVLPGGDRAAAVLVDAGRVLAVEPLEVPVEAATEVRLGRDEVLLPGLVDTHVHVNEPGRTEWEGFRTATRAAAAGGITTLLDMPLNSLPPTVDVPALAVKRAAAAGQVAVDVGFWGGAVPAGLGSLGDLYAAGVFGFKCFLVDSGVPEFPPLDPAGVAAALAELAPLDALLIAHAEDPAVLAAAPGPDGRSYRAFLASRPPEAETAAITGLLAAAAATGARVHVVHLSAAAAVPVLRAARERGVRVSAETCPHYLTLAAEEIAAGATEFKCCPPVRGADNRDLLWEALAAGDIQAVVSDHSPCTPELKRPDLGDFGLAWGGIASLQITLPVVWTEARRRGHPLADVVGWMGAGPAALAGLPHKGVIAPGAAADFAVFAPDEQFTVDPARLAHRNPVTPYAGRRLTGLVRRTWLAGQPIGDRPAGRLMERGDR
jgi:allantoinase